MTEDAKNLSSLDQQAFSALAEPYRRELQVHCYRMMGCVQDAEDMVQEMYLRAWRRRDTLADRQALRAWLYRIATNVCLDALDKQARRAVPVTYQPVSTLAEPIPPSIMESIWLEPYPDDWLVTSDDSPEQYLTTREDIALAFIAALHLLPPRQRAVLILRDVLNWPAREVASLLETSEAAVKSALHRARSTMAQQNTAAVSELDDVAQDKLEAYVQAWETADIDGLLRLLKADATFSMPPIPSWYRGHDDIRQLTSRTVFSGEAKGRWRLLPTRANRQLAFGLYRQSDKSGAYAAYGIQVLTLDDGLIADITTFRNPALCGRFGLPMTDHSV